MKIYASSRQKEPIEILREIEGKDLWIQTKTIYRPSFITWMKVNSIDEILGDIIIDVHKVEQRNDHFLINADDEEEILNNLLCDSYTYQITDEITDFEIIWPVDYATTDELVELIQTSMERWLAEE